MKFYSYDYMKSRINITDWLQLTIFVGLAILIGLAIWFYYHRNKDAQAKQAAISQYSGASHLMEQVAEDLGTKPELLYLNTEAAADGGIIKSGDRYYRTIIDREGHYILEEMAVQLPKIELVEVKP